MSGGKDEMQKEHEHCSTISCIALVGSISIANKLSNPFTLVASFENFWPNASERLCAGSVDYIVIKISILDIGLQVKEEHTMSRTDSRQDAS